LTLTAFFDNEGKKPWRTKSLPGGTDKTVPGEYEPRHPPKKGRKKKRKRPHREGGGKCPWRTNGWGKVVRQLQKNVPGGKVIEGEMRGDLPHQKKGRGGIPRPAQVKGAKNENPSRCKKGNLATYWKGGGGCVSTSAQEKVKGTPSLVGGGAPYMQL